MVLVVIVCELSAFLCHDHCEALLCLLTMFGMCVAVLIQQICFMMFHNTAHYKRQLFCPPICCCAVRVVLVFM